MPHRCTKCGTLFEDGSAAILNGCPNCGWNKFLYVRAESEAPKNIPGAALKEKMPVLQSSTDTAVKNVGDVVKNIDEALDSDNGSREGNIRPEGTLEEKKAQAAGKGERVESVKILGPGSYELNLDSLFERDELVMALKEEGSYALHLPSVFKAQKDKAKKQK